jgi:cytochrome c biogenesis protein ResB
MVLREDQEKVTYTQKVDFAKLRSELLTADSTEASLSRASHERLTNELAKLNSRLRDEVQRTQASVRLDLNLEKGRIREEANVQELKIKETETRIEQETAVLRERLEAVKFSTLQWLMYVFAHLMVSEIELTYIQRRLHWHCRPVTWCLAFINVADVFLVVQSRELGQLVGFGVNTQLRS